jgi:uncharacterized protein with HEPN domain
MSRNTQLYIEDIVKAINSIERFVENQTFEQFLDDERNQFAVMKGLEIIGEAGNKIEKHVLEKYPQIKWRPIIAVRNILVHEYFEIDMKVLWQIIHKDLPLLKAELSTVV